MNEAFSEYVLYEPILRILTARGYAVQSEVLCPGIQQPKTGDKKKLDFVACRRETDVRNRGQMGTEQEDYDRW